MNENISSVMSLMDITRSVKNLKEDIKKLQEELTSAVGVSTSAQQNLGDSISARLDAIEDHQNKTQKIIDSINELLDRIIGGETPESPDSAI